MGNKKTIEVTYSRLTTEAKLKLTLSQYIALSAGQEIFTSSSTDSKVLWEEKAGTLPHPHTNTLMHIFNQSNPTFSS